MTTYILRRLLLMVPTMLGITSLCFVLCQLLPGGPVDQKISQLRHRGGAGGSVAKEVPQEEIKLLTAAYDFDKPIPTRYYLWLKKLIHGDLGASYESHRPVLKVISEKFPLSLFFGLTSFVLSYLISIPLGVHKALTHGSVSDAISTGVVFAGYVIPNYTLGVVLIIFFAGGAYFDWFPIGNMVSQNFENLSTWGKAVDFLRHMVLPLICYMVSEFALLTMLMKNSMLDELGKDYIRTAIAKGLSFKQAVWRQAFRNALIPIATGIGSIFTLLFTGTLFIERVFDLDGMGLLTYNSMLNRDYPVVMGVIVLGSFFTMLGRLFSDIIYVVIDPRIRFD